MADSVFTTAGCLTCDAVPASATSALPSPAELRRAFPLTPAAHAHIDASRAAIRAILDGRGHRLLVVVGPCSIHDRESALAYGRWLADEQRRFADHLLLVMRCYVEKPRTRLGWTGFVHDPALDGSAGVADGLAQSRRLMLDLIAAGVPVATEFVEPAVAAYLGDLVSWSALGARTVESPVHRRMASGLACSVGFKNGTSGALQGAVDAMLTARSGHDTFGVGDDGRLALHHTPGLDHAHLILRGGSTGRNCTADDIDAAHRALRAHDLPAAVMVDCGHGNGDGTADGIVATGRRVAEQLAASPGSLIGVMLESHLEPGRQTLQAGVRPDPGRSITDPCIGLEQTSALLEAFAATRR